MKKSIQITSVLSLALALAACNDNNKPKQDVSQQKAGTTPLEGTWSATCQKLQSDVDNGQSGYVTETYTFQGNQYLSEVITYDDSQCKKTLSEDKKDQGTFTIGNKEAKVDDATDLDLTSQNGVKDLRVFRVTGKDLYLSQASQDASARSTTLDMSLALVKQDKALPIPAPSSQPSPAPSVSVNPPTVLEGVWSTSCLKLKAEKGTDEVNYEVRTVSFHLNDYTISATEYADAKCKTKVSDGDKQEGTFAIGDKEADSDNTDLDMTQSDNTKVLQIFKIDGEKLYLGVTGDSSVRPQKLDKSHPLLRQQEAIAQ